MENRFNYDENGRPLPKKTPPPPRAGLRVHLLPPGEDAYLCGKASRALPHSGIASEINCTACRRYMQETKKGWVVNLKRREPCSFCKRRGGLAGLYPDERTVGVLDVPGKGMGCSNCNYKGYLTNLITRDLG